MLTYIPLDICPGVEKQDHVVVLYLVLAEIFILISVVAALIYISTYNV
jgi:hypothetical protein